MVAKKKTKNTNSSATQCVKECEVKEPEINFFPEVEVWLNKIEKNCTFNRNQIVEALVFNAWERSLLEGQLTTEYSVANAQSKIKLRSN